MSLESKTETGDFDPALGGHNLHRRENYGPSGNSGLPMGVDLPGGKGVERGSPRSQGPGGHCREKTHTVPGPILDLARKMDQWPSVTRWCGEGFDGANRGRRQQRAQSMASNQSLNR